MVFFGYILGVAQKNLWVIMELMPNKNYILGIIVVVAIVIVVVLFLTKSDKNNVGEIMSPINLNLTASPTPTGTPEPRPMPTKPRGEIIFKEIKTYEQLVEELHPKGRHLVISPDCSYIVPSNVTYPNNTEIMLDNTASTERHILKIGGREYLLEAGEWFLTTLSSPTLPVNLPIFCGYMELGQIDLE